MTAPDIKAAVMQLRHRRRSGDIAAGAAEWRRSQSRVADVERRAENWIANEEGADPKAVALRPAIPAAAPLQIPQRANASAAASPGANRAAGRRCPQAFRMRRARAKRRSISSTRPTAHWRGRPCCRSRRSPTIRMPRGPSKAGRGSPSIFRSGRRKAPAWRSFASSRRLHAAKARISARSGARISPSISSRSGPCMPRSRCSANALR